MRAKFKVDSVTPFSDGESLLMSPVCASSYGKDGENEDNDFARWTPSGQLKMTVTNPFLLGMIKEGDTYYLDFIKCDKDGQE